MSFDPHNHITVGRYGVLTGQLEENISGQITVDGSLLSFVPYDALSLNKEYAITITAGLQSPILLPLQEDYEFAFTTRMDPMYSSYILVRQTGGAFLDTVSVDTINREIYHISLIVNSIIPAEIFLAPLPWYITRFVTCRVAFGLLTGAIEKVVIEGYSSKTLGDFRIEANTDIRSAVRPKLEELADCIRLTSSMIVNSGLPYAGAQWGVRAQTMFESALSDLTRWPITTGRTRSYDDIFGTDTYTKGKRRMRW